MRPDEMIEKRSKVCEWNEAQAAYIVNPDYF